MRLENEKYAEGMNISGGEHSGGWTFRGVKRPGGETSGGWNARWVKRPGVKQPWVKPSEGWIIRRGEKKNYKGVNRPGVNHKRGETSGIQIFCIFLFILQTCIGGFRVSTISTYFYFSQDFLSASYRFLPVDFLSYV